MTCEVKELILGAVLGFSVGLNFFFGLLFLKVAREESKWKDEHHRFIGTNSVYTD